MKIDFKNLTIKAAHEGLKNRQFSAWELALSYLDEIKEKEARLHAYLEVFADVREQAEEVDKTIRNSSRVDLEKKFQPLAGIPLAVKDNILIKGRVASSASRILEKYRAAYDATVIAKLKESGAIFLGRTNMDEFAMGSSTENSAFGVTSNPYDLSRVPGGSSGGSAAAVASGMAMAALGSDTGGSVRQPAAFCGVYGLKPTYGAVSRYGLMAMASSLDQIGPIARSVDDLEILFEGIRGHDPMDATSVDGDTELWPAKSSVSLPVKSPASAGQSSVSRRVGVPYHFLEKGLDPAVLDNFNQVLARLKALGYTIVPVDLPYIKYSLAVYYILMPAEASTNLARYDGVKYGLHEDGENLLEDYFKTRGRGFGKEPRRRIMLGTYVLSAGYYDAYYKKAAAVREYIKRDFETVFTGDAFGGQPVDAIITPTTPTPAFKIGEKASDPLSMYLADIFTVPANIAGLPALSLPSGFVERDGKKLPLGIQLTATYFKENLLFKMARDLEARSD